MTIKEISELTGRTQNELKELASEAGYMMPYIENATQENKIKIISSTIEVLNCEIQSLKMQQKNMTDHINNLFKVPKEKGHKSNVMTEFVYIMKSNNIYKIGRTKSLNNREKSLKTGNPDIKIIASLKTCKASYIEKKLHKLLKDKQYKNEWFELNEIEIGMIVKFFNFNKHIEE